MGLNAQNIFFQGDIPKIQNARGLCLIHRLILQTWHQILPKPTNGTWNSFLHPNSLSHLNLVPSCGEILVVATWSF